MNDMRIISRVRGRATSADNMELRAPDDKTNGGGGMRKILRRGKAYQ